MINQNMKLETPRLWMREFTEEDAALIFELDSDPEVHRFLGNQPLKDMDEAHEVIGLIRNQYVTRGMGRWATFRKDNNEFIGWSGFKLNTEELNGFNQFYDLGYRLKKKHWGQGYASECAKHLLAWGIQQFGQERIYAMTHRENEASRKVLIKSGFTERDIFLHDNMEVSWYDLEK